MMGVSKLLNISLSLLTAVPLGVSASYWHNLPEHPFRLEFGDESASPYRTMRFSSDAWPGTSATVSVAENSRVSADGPWYDFEPRDINHLTLTTDEDTPFRIGDRMNFVTATVHKNGKVKLVRRDGRSLEGSIPPKMAEDKIADVWQVLAMNYIPDGYKPRKGDDDRNIMIKEKQSLAEYLRMFVCKHNLVPSSDQIEDLVSCDVMRDCPNRQNFFDNEQCRGVNIPYGYEDDDDEDDESASEKTAEFFIVVSDDETGFFAVINSSYQQDEIRSTVAEECSGLSTELVGSTHSDVDLLYARIVIEKKSYEVPRRLQPKLWSKVVNRKFGDPFSYSLTLRQGELHGCELPTANNLGPELQAAMAFSYSDFTSLTQTPDSSRRPSHRRHRRRLASFPSFRLRLF